ncbi:DNA polymerase ligase N-terminal domain-containing protein [Singulisphaera rosea]
MARFVVLEHRWSGVHWDLMLEDGETLRTWAIDSPIVPGVDLPARSLPAHRRVYLDYEGEISGGRGDVRRVAQGTYTTLFECTDRLRIQLDGDQLAGPAEVRRLEVEAGSSEGAEAWIFRLGNLD